ncbi:DUF6527 family protein [Salipiger thiooxidans]|uniref:DUF6527 family protein n=1 Tax=Salipiger thiooxidans TaxID=282683 RepID=UPI001CFAA938|nr:DUF6527 family protein [Salipiger thiooxidans]
MIRAIYFDDRDKHREAGLSGSVHFTDPGDGGVSYMWFFCPCGCGDVSRIPTGVEHKPNLSGPSWNWNGRTDAPTLLPSVHMVGHWHGWLRDGYWESC